MAELGIEQGHKPHSLARKSQSVTQRLRSLSTREAALAHTLHQVPAAAARACDISTMCLVLCVCVPVSPFVCRVSSIVGISVFISLDRSSL
jgi:hypothetical protein